MRAWRALAGPEPEELLAALGQQSEQSCWCRAEATAELQSTEACPNPPCSSFPEQQLN